MKRRMSSIASSVGRTRSKGYIVLVSASSTTSEVRYLAADRPTEALKLILERKEGP